MGNLKSSLSHSHNSANVQKSIEVINHSIAARNGQAMKMLLAVKGKHCRQTPATVPPMH